MKSSAGSSNTVTHATQQNASSNVEQKDVAAFNALKSPSTDDLKIQLTRAIVAGEISPAQADTIYQQQSSMRDLQPDPVAAEAQAQSLAKLKAISANGGLDDADRAKLTNIYDTMTQTAKQNIQAVKENAAARGISGSGLDEMAQLQGAQSAQTNANRYYTQAAADAEAAKNKAITDAGTLGATMEGQRFQEGAAKANAQDEINKFNAANANNTAEANAARAQEAAKINQSTAQGVADKNTDIANTQAQANAASQQQAFSDAMDLAKGKSGAYSGSGTTTADSTSNSTNGTRNDQASFGTSISDRRLKHDVQDVTDGDADAFLDKVTGHKFKYNKNVDALPQAGKGQQMGVMAQDLEKTPEGKTLVDHTSNGVKVIDNGKLAATAIALMGNLHKRLKNLEAKS